MAESTDKKTRKIAEKRVEPGKEFESYQEAQNQLLAIQAEQQQNLALQANDAMNVQQQNQTLAQAADVMAMDNLNPATQGILAGYGLNQPRVIKQSNTQRQGPNNITINNTTINNASGPVQGREISIRPQEAGQSKFKAWLTNVFARQDAQWQKQNQEYARRESSLTRNSNKMMRRLEGLGKEIGNVIDPRKQAQRAQNSTMNLLKALGLVYFAKKLPDILGFFNNAEEKVRGWIGEIGDKIKEGLGGIFGTKDKDGFFNNLIHSLYNEEETGILNKLFKSIGNWISEHAEYASEKTGSMTNWLGLPEGEKVAKWLQLFFGGPNANVSITRRKIIENIRDDEFKDKAVRSSSQQENWTGNYKLTTNSAGRFGVSRTDGGITESYFSMGGDNDWANWKKANGITNGTDKDASRFFREKGYAYTAEAYILLKSTWNITQGRIFSEKYDLTALGTLPSNTVYPQLAASLEIIREYKRGIRINGNSNGLSNTNVIFFLLDLLVKKASSNGHVTVFEEFLKCIAKDTRIPQLKKDGLIKERQYKLVMEPMTPADQNRYMSSSRILMSNYYKKLVPIDGENKEQALTLAEEDYRGISGANNWTFIEITHSGLGTLLEEATGTKSIDFSRDQKRKFMNTFRTNIKSINHGIDLGTNHFTYDDTSEDFENFFEATQEKKDYDYQREEERKKREAERGENQGIIDGFLQFVGIKPKKIRVKEQEDFNKRRDQVINYLTKDLGLDKSVAIGITGVLYNESGLNPAAVSRDGKTKKPNGGQGLAQWTSKRRKNFKDWYTSTKNKSYPTSDEEGVDGIVKIPLEEQLEFLGYELKNSYPNVYNKLKEVGQDASLSEYDKLYRGTYIWMKDFEGGGVSEENWPKVYSHTDNLGNRIPHYFEDSFKKRFESSLGLYEDISGTNLEIPENTTTPSQTTPNTNPKNPNNTQKSGGYRPAGTVGFATELDEYSEVMAPTSITPSTNFSTSYPSDSGSLAMAENITPTEQVSQSSENNNEILLARCAEGIDYIAKTMAPLSEVINSGNMMVAEAVSKSGGPTNLTPHEPQLEMNQV